MHSTKRHRAVLGITRQHEPAQLGALYFVLVTFTLNVPDDFARHLEAVATSRGVSIETAVVEALTNWASGETMPELSFVGIGEGRPDLAESHAEILVEHVRDAP